MGILNRANRVDFFSVRASMLRRRNSLQNLKKHGMSKEHGKKRGGKTERKTERYEKGGS